jgi:hypothetical protein
VSYFEFCNINSPTAFKDRLHWLDPPIGTDKKIEIDDYREISDLREAVDRQEPDPGSGASWEEADSLMSR